MLTRLEVDGFKNLLKLEVDFGPFNCIAGPNGVGKSNIFDAIRFLSLLADHTITDAALAVRGNPNTADIRDLFWTDGEVRAEKFCMAAEMIVEPKVFDDIGRPVEPTSTYLRYEIEIAYRDPNLENGNLGGLFLLSETLHGYSKEEVKERLRFPHTEEFFEAVIGHQKGALQAEKRAFISTNKAANGPPEIIWYANGTSSGSAQSVSALKIPRTIVAGRGIWTSATILAAQREMQSWKILAMDPKAIRTPDPVSAEPHLTPTGGHLHATLYRVATTAPNHGSYPEQVYARIRNRLAGLLSVKKISVDLDPVRQLLTTQVEKRFGGGQMPARALSDGTLRFLTLAVLSQDPDFRGLLCIEEPENGIHPAGLSALVEQLKEMVVDPSFEPSQEEDNLMRQIIIATHSPHLVQLLEPDDLLIARQSIVPCPSGKPTETLQCLPLSDTWRHRKNSHRVDWISMLDYLVAPPTARVKLPASLFDD